MKYNIGIDIGGMSIKFGLVNESGEIVARDRIVTSKDQERAVEEIAEVVKKHNIPNTLSPEAANIAAGSLYYSGLKKALVNKDLYAIRLLRKCVDNIRFIIRN